MSQLWIAFDNATPNVLRSGNFYGKDPNFFPGCGRRPRKIKARKSHNRKHHKPRK